MRREGLAVDAPSRWLASVTVLLVAVGLPLFMDAGGYVSLGIAKGHFVFIILLVLAIGVAITSVAGFFMRHSLRPHRSAGFNMLDWAVLAYTVASVASCFVSKTPLVAINGVDQFGGTACHVCCAMVYYVISRKCWLPEILLKVVVSSWTVIFVWSFVNAFGVNIFGLYDKLGSAFHIDEIVSCLGHFNAASAFFCLSVPLVAMLFMRCETLFDRILYGTGSFSGMLALLTICADGMWYGLLPAAALMVFYAAGNGLRVRRLWTLALMAGVSLIVFRILLSAGYVHRTESESVFLAEHCAGEFLTALSLGALVFIRCKQRPIFTRRAGVVVAASLMAVSVGIALLSFYLGMCNPHFGTGRGAAWKGSIWTYRLYSPVEKVFGSGCGGFAKELSTAVRLLLDRPKSPVIYFTCHNSILQALLAQGVVGLIAMAGGVAGLFRLAVSRFKAASFSAGFHYFVAVVAYMGQSLVTSPYIVSIVPMFLILGLYRGMCLES